MNLLIAARDVLPAAFAAALAITMSPASAEPRPNLDLINKMDGSRLALSSNSTAEGATAITLRDPAWKYSTEQWDAEETPTPDEPGGWTAVYKNRAANKCLQPASASPGRGTQVIVQTCNGSDLQKWLLEPEKVNDAYTGWWMWRPKVNRNVALSLARYNDGSWDTLYLDTAYPSNDRLWSSDANDSSWSS
ncbi:hypothetical protein GCM10023195_01630 [Actinoallomurus liliacearum]|uniref:Ricin B lectin domain-containing protein n=1 Tax=Actinoallomurus liliacearum TaxID=1080073 RepID=A0ABP8TC39_9ACTN